MSLASRDVGEIEALVTDRYLDALLAGATPPQDSRSDERGLDAAIRAASRRLADDLPRFHPSFRFEERLAVRLAEAAAAMRLPMAAGAERAVVHLPAPPAAADPLAIVADDEGQEPGIADGLSRPAVIRGAVAASALSLAGAAWFAWRHRPATSPMARAARAAHAVRRT